MAFTNDGIDPEALVCDCGMFIRNDAVAHLPALICIAIVLAALVF